MTEANSDTLGMGTIGGASNKRPNEVVEGIKEAAPQQNKRLRTQKVKSNVQN